MYDFAIRFEQDETGVAVFCRDLPELNSFGDDIEHAIREAMDALDTTLSLYVDQRRAIPSASEPQEGEHVVQLPAVTVAKIALWNAMVERNMRKADLCRLLDIHQAQGDRLVDFLHTSKMEALENALAALGKRLLVSPASYTRYEVFYIHCGELKTLKANYNDNTDAWSVLLAGLKLKLPKDLESPSPEQVCRNSGISHALLRAS